MEEKYKQAAALVSKGATLTEACEQAKLAKSAFYYWRAKEAKGVRVITHSLPKAKRRASVMPPPASMFTAAQVAELLRAVARG